MEYFLYDGANVVDSYASDGNLNARYITPGLDMNLSMTRGGSTYYYLADGLGSVRNVVESDEDVANTYDYYAFGNTLGTPTTGVTNPFEYTGREFENGSVNTTFFYRNRYYMSGLGIFTSRDAMSADPGRGWGYVGNNPVTWTDPYGLIVAIVVINGEDANENQIMLNFLMKDFADLRRYGENKKGPWEGKDAWNRVKNAINDPNKLYVVVVDLKGRPKSKGAGFTTGPISDLGALSGNKPLGGDWLDEQGNLLPGVASGLVNKWDCAGSPPGASVADSLKNTGPKAPFPLGRLNGAFANTNELGKEYGASGYFLNEFIHELQHMHDLAHNVPIATGPSEDRARNAETNLAVPFLDWQLIDE